MSNIFRFGVATGKKMIPKEKQQTEVVAAGAMSTAVKITPCIPCQKKKKKTK